jgi:2-polyprenyl-3-methyl-5-hydroxy-6-metoxy-1,4-benzoquinol methylase
VAQPVLDAFYASGAYWYASQGSSAQLAHERNQAKHRVSRSLPSLEGRITVADVGAGHGAIAEWLDRLAGGRVVRYDFVEPDAANRQFILGRATRFPVAAFDGVTALGADYDLIFLNHVLEHIADPVEFVDILRGRLRPGGLLYVETPHSDYRFKDDVFPHTLFFTQSAFARLAARVGMDLIECAAFGAYPGRPAGVGPWAFRVLGAAFHWAARAGVPALCARLDDAIWRYDAREDGMWMRAVAKRRA